MNIYRDSLRAAAMGLAVAGVVAAPNVAQAEPSIDELRRMIEVQQQQINQMRAAMEETRRGVKSAEMKADEAKMQAAVAKPKFLDHLTIGGVAEVEMTETETFARASNSDIALATVEVFFDAELNKYLNTHIQFIYEDDGTETVGFDEGNFTLGNTDEFPVYLMGGKWGLPFGSGSFDTAMSSDPLTKNLGELKEAALLVGGTYEGATLEGYFYNGDTQRGGEGDQIDQFGVNLGYGTEVNGVAFNVAGGYLNNMADTDGLTTGLGANTTALNDYVGGVEIHGDVAYQGFEARGGYMTAAESFQTGELAFNGQGAKPVAWFVEGAYTMPILTKDTTFAATIQGTKEALALGLPELRVGGAVTVGIVEHFAVTAEYLHDEDYGTSDGGTGNSGHTATLKLAADF